MYCSFAQSLTVVTKLQFLGYRWYLLFTEFNTKHTLFIALDEILDMKRRWTELEGVWIYMYCMCTAVYIQMCVCIHHT